MIEEHWSFHGNCAEDGLNIMRLKKENAKLKKLIEQARPHMEYLLDDCNLHDDLECIVEWLDKVKEMELNK